MRQRAASSGTWRPDKDDETLMAGSEHRRLARWTGQVSCYSVAGCCAPSKRAALCSRPGSIGNTGQQPQPWYETPTGRPGTWPIGTWPIGTLAYPPRAVGLRLGLTCNTVILDPSWRSPASRPLRSHCTAADTLDCSQSTPDCRRCRSRSQQVSVNIPGPTRRDALTKVRCCGRKESELEGWIGRTGEAQPCRRPALADCPAVDRAAEKSNIPGI